MSAKRKSKWPRYFKQTCYGPVIVWECVNESDVFKNKLGIRSREGSHITLKSVLGWEKCGVLTVKEITAEQAKKILKGKS